MTVVARIETGSADVRMSTYEALMNALQEAGIELLKEGQSIGVMLNR